MSQLKDMVCVVTGASRGIGRAISVCLGDAGAKLAISGRDQKQLKKTLAILHKRNIDAIAISADVTNEEAVSGLIHETVKYYGSIDCAINNAGVEGDMKPIHEQTDENFDNVFDTNVRSVFYCMKHQVIQFQKQGNEGVIVNIASVAGFRGFPGASFYVGSKHAVIGLTRSAAQEYAQEDIRINAISPGGVDTDMLDRFVGNDIEAKAQFAQAHAMGRLGRTDEIGRVCVFLCSQQSTFITGQNIIVDGGFSA